MRYGRKRLNKKTVFAGLMILSVLAIFLPPRITDAPKHSTQLFVPVQDLVYFATHWASRSVSEVGDSGRDQLLSLEALRNQVVSQQGLIEQLRAENRRLGAIQKKAIPLALQAQVVTRDIAAWRDSFLVERGSERGVRRRDWAASRLFVDQGYINQTAVGQAVLAREVLLGRVEHVSPYMSRVQLLTDVASAPIEVRVGGESDGAFEFVEYPCSLRGQGRGKMVISNVDYRYIDTGRDSEETGKGRRIRIGDYVCSAPGQLGLPEPMVIGRVAEMEENHRKRLVYNVIVEPAVGLDDIRHVHLIPLLATGTPVE